MKYNQQEMQSKWIDQSAHGGHSTRGGREELAELQARKEAELAKFDKSHAKFVDYVRGEGLIP